MGVDGIGKGAGVSPESSQVGDSEGVTGTGDAFRADATDSVGEVTASGETDVTGVAEVDVATYLEGQVDVAVAHLEGQLSAEQLATLREHLREQLDSDPTLIELVRRATGRAANER